jgi:hypothetical protein
MDKYIVMMVEQYQSILIEENEAEKNFILAQDALEYEKARVISIAYSDRSIDGKTAEIRKWQETVFIANTASIALLGEYWWEAKNILDEIQSARKSVEAEIGLTKAFLYSKTGSIIKD